MSKLSSVHPKLKAALGSLELDLESELARYEHHDSNSSPWECSEGDDSLSTGMVIAEVSNLVESIPKTPEPINPFTTPFGVGSLILTTLASGLLGFNYVQISEEVPPEIVPPPMSLTDGVNLAVETEPLNLKTLTKIKLESAE